MIFCKALITGRQKYDSMKIRKHALDSLNFYWGLKKNGKGSGLKNIFHKIVYYLTKFGNETNQLTFTCSKSTIETQEKGVKYVQSLQ